MPRSSKGARLWLRAERRDESGAIVGNALWVIKDAGRQFSTGCGEGDREQAEQKLAAYIAEKYAPDRRDMAKPWTMMPTTRCA